MTQTELIEALYNELRVFVDGESCDHSVGVCYCETFALLDKAENALDTARTKEGADLFNSLRGRAFK